MKWKITGADRQTGSEAKFEVEARNETEAINAAAERGYFVESATPAGPGIIRATSAPRAMPQTYLSIVNGAGLLMWFATLTNIVGLVAIIGGLVLAALISQQPGSGSTLAAVTAGAVGVSYGIVCFVSAAFLNMQAGLALAVRDIAINSFKPGH